jgi:serine/threonine protein kinase
MRLHASFQSYDNLFLVMEYVSGGDLATQLATYSHFDLERSRFYAAEMMAGIIELHRHRIIYRGTCSNYLFM